MTAKAATWLAKNPPDLVLLSAGMEDMRDNYKIAVDMIGSDSKGDVDFVTALAPADMATSMYPRDSGYQKMAALWQAAVLPLI
ncbi:MAG: hypothetical protein LBJ44_02105 [Propionibacteriaceae bacterium]|nr:hypothetical protein [Propionibacteriaceae bacterium]